MRKSIVIVVFVFQLVAVGIALGEFAALEFSVCWYNFPTAPREPS